MADPVGVPATVFGAVLRGMDAVPIEVQVDVSNGKPGFFLVGLAAAAVKEARERVRAAIRNSGLKFAASNRHVAISLAPAELPKDGSGLDLPIAVGLVLGAAREEVPGDAAFVGELSLDGTLRHTAGVLVMALGLRGHGFRHLFVPAVDAPDAVRATGLSVYACPDLASVLAHLRGEVRLEPQTQVTQVAHRPPDPIHDLREVYGQTGPRRALEVAAAGGHHLLLSGPPGGGKTMLARCLPGILPALEEAEELEIAQVRSVLGELEADQGGRYVRPFRSPHHSVSTAGLVGGGQGLASPGEISRAAHGVLFLDELAEFKPGVLQALRQPLEQGVVSITRTGGTVVYPARFMLVAATNPCPCGFIGDEQVGCRCSPAAISSYQRALSGPLLDRIDLRVKVARPPIETLTGGSDSECSASVRERVSAARRRQLRRQGFVNSQLRPRSLKEVAPLEGSARTALQSWAESRFLTARGFHRAWRVALTLADLAGSPGISERHVLEALGYRLDVIP